MQKDVYGILNERRDTALLGSSMTCSAAMNKFNSVVHEDILFFSDKFYLL